MKKGIHPENYRFVVFKDMSCNHSFLTRSTAQSKDAILWEDGNEYPLIKLEISDQSHPFYTGKMKLVDTAGRVDKFRSKYKKHIKTTAGSTEAPAKEEPKPRAEAPAPEVVEEAPVVEAKEETKAEEVMNEAPNEESPETETEDTTIEGEDNAQEGTPAAEENTEEESEETPKTE